MRAIFALDPGGSSGLAWGVFDTSPDLTVAEAMRSRLHADSTTVVGDEYEQIKLIATFWMTFYRECVYERLLDPQAVEFVCEDFVQRPGPTPGGKEGQSPIRIMWGVEGYRMGRADEFKGRKINSKARIHAPRMILQLPSDSSAYGTKQRLKDWNCWVVGREHERSAWKHVALRVARIQRLQLSSGT